MRYLNTNGMLNSRKQNQRKKKHLGRNIYGVIVGAFDKKRESRYAVKLTQSEPAYQDAAHIELQVLQTLSLNSQQNRIQYIHIRDYFDFRNRICIVTKLFNPNISSFLQDNKRILFLDSQIQRFAQQLLTSVTYK